MTGSTRSELHARLLALCEVFRAAGGHMSCVVTLDASHTCFGEEVGEVVYRTVRELLANVLQHAKATRVELSSVRRRDGSIGIVVADNGIGLPPHRRRGRRVDETGGSGLWSIDRQLRALDAMLDVEAAAGEGTRAMVILPAQLVDGD
jgi:signal transduction histidine kinase